MSTANKLSYLNDTKSLLRTSLNKFGSSILSTDTFRSYDTKLNDIYDKLPKITQSGAGFTLLDVQNGQVDDFKIIGTDLYQNQLPSEYTAVEYLQSDNECYIDTGINADYKLSLKMKVACLDSVLEYMGAIKNIDNTNYIRHHLAFAPTAGNIIGIYYGQTNDQLILKEFDNNFHEFNLDIYNKKVSIDNDSPISISYNNFDVGINYYLFARNGSNIAINKGSYKIAYCKMYYQGNLVRDFVPCYRNSDNVAGLYDFVTNTFFTNQGTGTFTVGNTITLPNPDYPQEIKVVEGRQVITDKGKNLFQALTTPSEFYKATYTKINENSFSLNYTQSSTSNFSAFARIDLDISKLKPDTEYTISTSNVIDGVNFSNIGALRTRINGENGSVINSNSLTFTTPNTIENVGIYFYIAYMNTTTGTATITFNNIQVEEGSISTDYEPYYNPVSYNIDLQLANIYLAKMPNTDYKNRIYKNNGNWFYEKNVEKYIFNSERILAVNDYQSSSTGTSKNGTYSIVISDMGISVSNNKMMALDYKYELNSNVVDNYSAQNNMTDNTFCLRQETNDRIYFKCSNYANKTANEISELINGNYIYYALATPATTQITNTTLINQLEAISVYTGTNIITISNDNNIIPEIEITRLKELEKLA